MCVANAGRSQMAEGITRFIAPDGVAVFSAGSAPTQVNPIAVRAMKEIGIDISAHRSKNVAEVPLDRVDLVITLCDEEVCPTLPPDIKHANWPMSDPDDEPGNEADRLAAFRRVRDAVRERVSAMF